MDTAPLISNEELDRYHLVTLLRSLLRHPYHDYPSGWPESWVRRLHWSGAVEWHYHRAGYWQAYATRDGDALLDWASELERQHPWLRP